MASDSKELLFKVRTDLSQAQSSFGNLNRTLQELLKTVTQINGAMIGGGGGGQGHGGGGNGSGGGGGGGLLGGNEKGPNNGQTRLAKIILDNQNAIRKLRTTSAKEFEAATNVIDRSIEQEGKRIDAHTAKLDKLIDRYERRKQLIADGKESDPDFINATDRMGKRVVKQVELREKAQENLEELQKLRSGKTGIDPATIRTITGVLGGVGAVMMFAGRAVNDIKMEPMRNRVAEASVAGSALGRYYSGDMSDAFFMAKNQNLINNINRASGQGGEKLGGWGSIAGGAALLTSGALTTAGIGWTGVGLGLAIPQFAAGGAAIYHGIKGLTTAAQPEAARIQEAIEAAKAQDPIARIAFDDFQARSERRLAQYRIFGRDTAQARYNQSALDPYRRYNEDELAGSMTALYRAGGLNVASKYSSLPLDVQRAGGDTGTAAQIAANIAIGGGDPNLLMKSAFARAGLGDDISVIQDVLAQGSGRLVGPNGATSGAGYLGALTAGMEGLPAERQRVVAAQNAGGVNLLNSMSTGSIDGYQAGRNLLSAVRVAGNKGLYTQQMLASLDSKTLLDLAADGKGNEFTKAAGITGSMARAMLKDIGQTTLSRIVDDGDQGTKILRGAKAAGGLGEWLKQSSANQAMYANVIGQMTNTSPMDAMGEARALTGTTALDAKKAQALAMHNKAAGTPEDAAHGTQSEREKQLRDKQAELEPIINAAVRDTKEWGIALEKGAGSLKDTVTEMQEFNKQLAIMVKQMQAARGVSANKKQ